MITSKMLDTLNKQTNFEHYSSNIYLSMASWCARNGYNGSSKYLMKAAMEERNHQDKLYNYVLEIGEQVIIEAIPQPKTSWNSLIEVFKDSLAHEKLVSASINELMQLCLDEQDFSTFAFLSWYAGEQHEEEAKFIEILDMFAIVDNDPKWLFELNEKIGDM